jgi:DNA repair exonuclease SbcCD ATPase subunit
LEQTLQKHVYRDVDYKKDQEQLKQIESQLADYENLQKDVAQQENRKNNIKKLCCTLKDIKTAMQETEIKRADLGDLAAQLHLLQEKEKDLESQRIALKNKKELLLHAKGSIENQHKQLAKIKDELMVGTGSPASFGSRKASTSLGS